MGDQAEREPVAEATGMAHLDTAEVQDESAPAAEAAEGTSGPASPAEPEPEPASAAGPTAGPVDVDAPHVAQTADADEMDAAEPGDLSEPAAASVPAPLLEALREALAGLPADVAARLAERDLAGASADAARAYVEEGIEARVAARLAAERETWAAEALPALRKQALAALNGGDSPEIGMGSAAASGPVTQVEFSRHGRDPAWRRANRDRINAGLAQGLIRHA